MSKTITTLMLVTAFSFSATVSFAADTGKKPSSLPKDASDAMQKLSKESEKAEQAIKNSKPLNDIQTGTGAVMETLRTQTKRATNAVGNAINTGVNQNKPLSTPKQNQNPNQKISQQLKQEPNTVSETPLDRSLDEFGKNASKAGAAFQESVKNMGQKASEQIAKSKSHSQTK